MLITRFQKEKIDGKIVNKLVNCFSFFVCQLPLFRLKPNVCYYSLLSDDMGFLRVLTIIMLFYPIIRYVTLLQKKTLCYIISCY